MSEIDTTDTLRKPGEMFTGSILKKLTPHIQFVFSLALSLFLMAISHYVLKSEELVMYSGSFGVIFFVLFNPWLQLLTEKNTHYFLYSLLYYFIIAFVMYGLIYIWFDKSMTNSMEVRITLITSTFYFITAYGIMSAIKYLFVDNSGGGL
jgi:hypothetical protein